MSQRVLVRFMAFLSYDFLEPHAPSQQSPHVEVIQRSKSSG